MIRISNEFYNLGNDFFTLEVAKKTNNPKIIIKNNVLLDRFNINLPEKELTLILSGNKPIANYYASVYAGHQFGSFNPMLGDGRALILGNIRDVDNNLYEIAFKGSGKTKYSRGGDGLLSIGAAIREYLLSKYFMVLGIPTTYALSISISDDNVVRDSLYQASVLTRIAKSFIRVGSYEYFLSTQNIKAIKQLSEYLISHHFNEIASENYLDFFQEICLRQAKLIAQWQSIGFIHGVMNTDNMSIVGETIDYGPCAFMDSFMDKKVFSSIDHYGRYAFNNQPQIAVWNLTSLANCLITLFDDKTKIINKFEQILIDFSNQYNKHYYNLMAKKLAIKPNPELVNKLLKLLEIYSIDYTEFFINLGQKNIEELKLIYNSNNDFVDFLNTWNKLKDIDYKKIMAKNNPYIIPRNHQIEKAISLANNQDFSYFYKLDKALETPFIKNNLTTKFFDPPTAKEVVTKTFCGT